MSARFYPRFVKGNPQLRIFLPNWKMTMIKPKTKMPSNIVTFKVDPKMTEWDVKNYIEKIYNVPVGGIRSYIKAGPLIRTLGELTKGPDSRIVSVTLPIGQTFEWPELYPKDKLKEEKEDFELLKDELKKTQSESSWFT